MCGVGVIMCGGVFVGVWYVCGVCGVCGVCWGVCGVCVFVFCLFCESISCNEAMVI